MSVFWVLLGIAVLGGVAMVASGRGQGLTDAVPDRPDLTLPQDRPIAREDVDRLRFSVGLRGYRMDEVDDVLDRLAVDIAMRDEQIGGLHQELARLSATTQAPSAAAAPEPGQAPVLEGAALVPPVDTPADPVTSRTLLVPLEQFEDRPGPEGGPDDSVDGAAAPGPGGGSRSEPILPTLDSDLPGHGHG